MKLSTTRFVVLNRNNGKYMTSEPFCGFDQGEFNEAHFAGNDLEQANVTLRDYRRTIASRVVQYEYYGDLTGDEEVLVEQLKQMDLILIKVWEQSEIVLSPVEEEE